MAVWRIDSKTAKFKIHHLRVAPDMAWRPYFVDVDWSAIDMLQSQR